MILIKRVSFILLLFLFFCTINIGCSEDSSTKSEEGTPGDSTKHVLVIGIDGVRPDALKVSDTPNMDKLINAGAVSYNAYAGGEFGMETQQATSGGPGWSSILTGVWVNKHNVSDNGFSDPNYDEYPCFFTRIKEVRPNAYLSSIVHWEPINNYIIEDADYEDEGSDVIVAVKAVAHLESQDPDVLFLHFDDVDHAGHAYEYSPTIPEYVESIHVVDKYIGSVITGIESRSNYKNEDWLIIITTDHGGSGSSHGGQSDVERTIPFIVSGKNTQKGEISQGPGHVAVPATVCKHLEIEVNPDWGWESGAFGLN